MSNASTIRRQVNGTQQLTIAPLVGTVITTTQTVFTLNNNALTLTGGGIIPLSAGVTGLYLGTGQVLWIHVAGHHVGATADHYTIDVYEVTAAQVAAGLTNAIVIAATTQVISTTGSITVNNADGSFFLDTYVQLSPSGQLYGNFQGNCDATIVDIATLSNVQTGLTEADLNFLVSLTLATAEVGTFYLDEFSLNFV